jgi:hypothetical protein
MPQQFTSDSRDIQSLLASTLEKTVDSGVVQDLVFKMRPLLNRLRESGNLMVVNGGERLRVQFQYDTNSTVDSYTDDELLDVTRQDNVTSAFFAWKQYSVSIVITGKEIRINKGSETALFNLLEQKTFDAAQSLQKRLAYDMFTDGTGNGSKNITGLEAALEDSPGTVIYGGVPKENTKWRNDTVSTTVGAAAVNLLPNMRTGSNNVLQIGGSGDNMGVDLWVTTQTIHESFEALHAPQVRFTSETADLSVPNPPFKGGEVLWDPDCVSGNMYGLNLSAAKLFVHEDANFGEAEGGLQRPVNQDSFISQLLFQGNFLTNNRAKHTKLAGIT